MDYLPLDGCLGMVLKLCFPVAYSVSDSEFNLSPTIISGNGKEKNKEICFVSVQANPPEVRM